MGTCHVRVQPSVCEGGEHHTGSCTPPLPTHTPLSREGPHGVKLDNFMKRMEERHERELSAVKEELRREREAHTIEIAELKQLIESKMAELKKEIESKMAEEMKVHIKHAYYSIQYLRNFFSYRMSMLLKQR